jgi:hypothetical protein
MSAENLEIVQALAKFTEKSFSYRSQQASSDKIKFIKKQKN